MSQKSASTSANKSKTNSDSKKEGVVSKEQMDKLDEILNVYNKNNQMLDNMIAMSNEMIDVGSQSASRLKGQSERLNHANKQLDDMGSKIKKL